MNNINIKTKRFTVRSLKVTDVSYRYAGWLADENVSRYIAVRVDIDELRHYVFKKTEQRDTVFLGIFEKHTQLHIGNIKYEPINNEMGYAIMGILIGDDNWRGKGVAKEVISATKDWLKKNTNVNRIILGVNVDNKNAIRAYQKIGFVNRDVEHIKHKNSSGITMVWDFR